jgi:hypothetical protein
MAQAQVTKVVVPKQGKKAPYRVPEDAGFFAPREPVSGTVPPSVSNPPEPGGQATRPTPPSDEDR